MEVVGIIVHVFEDKFFEFSVYMIHKNMVKCYSFCSSNEKVLKSSYHDDRSRVLLGFIYTCSSSAGDVFTNHTSFLMFFCFHEMSKQILGRLFTRG